MKNLSNEITALANQAFLKITADADVIDIRNTYRWRDQSNWGTLILLLGGFFFIFMPFLKASTPTSKIIGIILGALLLLVSVFSLIQTLTNRFQIHTNKLLIQHNLQKTILPLHKDMMVKMKTDSLKIRRVNSMGSDFIVVSHYVTHQSVETKLWSFTMASHQEEKALTLGNEISRFIQDRIAKLN